MNITLRRAATSIALVVSLASCAAAITLPGQAVTYADFSYVNSVATSINRAYFATTEGIIYYDRNKQQWLEPLTATDGLPEEEIRRIWVEQFDEKLYARTTVDLYEYDFFLESWFPIDELPDLPSRDKHIATPDALIPPSSFNYFGEGELVDPLGRDFALSDIVDDQSGTLWMGTWGYGPARAGNVSRVMEFLPYGLLQNRVDVIYDDGRRLWVSGAVARQFRTGLSGFDPDKNEFTYIESQRGSAFPDVDIIALDGDDKNLYVGTEDGLYVLNRRQKRVTLHLNDRRGLIDDVVTAIKKVGDSLFVGTQRGLNLFTFNADSIKQIGSQQFFSEIIYDLEVTPGYLWIGSSAGAFRLSFADGRLQRFQDPSQILFSRVYDIEPSGVTLWLVGDDGIVWLDLETGATQSFVDAHRGAVKRVISASSDVMAVTSDNGMRVYFLNTKDINNREFTTADGLASSYVNALYVDGDYIWVGTDRGLTRFLWNNPDRVD